jgi:hypothetical protein
VYQNGGEAFMFSFVPIFEVFDNPPYGEKHPLENQPGLPLVKQRNFVYGYLDQDLGIQLDISGNPIESLDAKPEKLVFTFKKISFDCLTSKQSSGIHAETVLHGSRNGGYEVKPPVPILSGAIMQNLQHGVDKTELSPIRFGSVVRLYRLNPIPELLREWKVVDSALFKSIRIDADRKLDTILVGGGIDFFGEYGRLIDEGIQSSPELIKHFSQLDSEIIFEDRRVDESGDSACPVAIHLYDRFIGFWIEKGFPYRIESFRVRHCPFESLPTFGK